MKRFIILLMAISCAGFILAQDVIELKNGNRIENVYVSGKTAMEIQYIQNEEFLSVSRDSVVAIFHNNGSIEYVFVDDPQFVAMIDSMGLDVNYVKQSLDRGADLQHISWCLWQDESYSKKCRDLGIKAFFMTHSKVYQEALKNAKKSGLKGKDAKEVAQKEAATSKLPIKAGNETIRDCAGEL